MVGRNRKESTTAWGNDDSQEESVSNGIKLIRSCIVEFLGDLIFIFIGSLSPTSKTGLTGIALAHGLCIFVLIASMGHISGGHFNPAVTMGVLTSGNIKILNGLCYMGSQLLGGFIGALLVRVVVHGDRYDTGWASIGGINGGLTLPGPEDPFLEALTCEIIFTFLLVLTVLMTAVDTDSNLLAPLAIGLSITVDIFAGGTVSGASMNPARTLGPALAYSIFGSGYDHWKHQWVYFIGPLFGALISALIYKAFLAKGDKRWLLK